MKIHREPNLYCYYNINIYIRLYILHSVHIQDTYSLLHRVLSMDVICFKRCIEHEYVPLCKLSCTVLGRKVTVLTCHFSTRSMSLTVIILLLQMLIDICEIKEKEKVVKIYQTTKRALGQILIWVLVARLIFEKKKFQERTKK